MKIYCHTNLDVRESWPTELPVVPRVGDLIESKPLGSNTLVLRVISVRWSYSHAGYFPNIELHDPVERSIHDFQNWYKRR